MKREGVGLLVNDRHWNGRNNGSLWEPSEGRLAAATTRVAAGLVLCLGIAVVGCAETDAPQHESLSRDSGSRHNMADAATGENGSAENGTSGVGVTTSSSTSLTSSAESVPDVDASEEGDAQAGDASTFVIDRANEAAAEPPSDAGSSLGATANPSPDGATDVSHAIESLSREPMKCELSGHKEVLSDDRERYFLALSCDGLELTNSRCYAVDKEQIACDCDADYGYSIFSSVDVGLAAARQMSLELCNVERVREVSSSFDLTTESESEGVLGCSLKRSWRPLLEGYSPFPRAQAVTCLNYDDAEGALTCSCEMGQISTLILDEAGTFSVLPSSLDEGCTTAADLCLDFHEFVPSGGASCESAGFSVNETGCSGWTACHVPGTLHGVAVNAQESYGVSCASNEHGQVTCTISGRVRRLELKMPEGTNAAEACGSIPADDIVHFTTPSQNPLPTAAELLAATPLSNFEGPAPQ